MGLRLTHRFVHGSWCAGLWETSDEDAPERSLSGPKSGL